MDRTTCFACLALRALAIAGIVYAWRLDRERLKRESAALALRTFRETMKVARDEARRQLVPAPDLVG